MALLAPIARAESFGTYSGEPRPKKSVSQLWADKENLAQDKKILLVKGEVQKVCKKKGCWMTLADSKKKIRVVFKDYSFFVGQKLVGTQVEAEGVVEKKIQSVAEQKHFLKDEAAPKEALEKVVDDQLVYQFVASYVRSL